MPEPKLDPQAAYIASLPKEAGKNAPMDASRPLEERQSVRNEAARARKAVEEGGDESPAQTLQEALSRVDTFSKSQADEARDANIGTETEINPTTGEVKKKTPPRHSPEAQRIDDVNNFDANNREILEKKGNIDIDELKEGGKYEHVFKGLNELIDASPLAYMDAASRKALFEVMLKDEAFLQELAQGGMDNVTFRIEGADELIEARRKRDEAKAKFDPKEVEKNGTDQQLEDAKNLRDEYGDTTTPGRKGHRLEELLGKKLETEIAKGENRLRSLNSWLDDPSIAPSELSPGVSFTVAAATAEVNTIIGKMNTYNTELKERRDLEREKNELPQKIRELTTDKARVDGEYFTLQAELNSAESAYSSAYLKRSNAENKWVEGKKNLARDAMQRVIDKNREAVEGKEAERHEQQGQEETGEVDKHMADFLEKRYFKDRDPSVRKSSRKEIKKDRAHKDMEILLKQGRGVDELVREALAEKFEGDTDKIEKYMKNSEFVNKWGVQMASYDNEIGKIYTYEV